MVVLLVFELAFIGALAALLAQAEAEGARQERAREISARASRLMLVMYDTGDSVGRYARILQVGTEDAKPASKEEVPIIVDWLKRELKDDAGAQQLLANIEKNINICLPVVSEIEQNKSNLADETEREKWRQKRADIQPMVNQLVKDIPALIAISRKMEDAAPEQERQTRKLTQIVLLSGLVFNIFIVLVIAILFTSRITGRLDDLAENIARLKDGRLLKPVMNGNDELATLDAVIHQTAYAMRRELKVLKASEQRVRALIENLPLGIVMLDESGTIEYVNRNIEATFGIASHQLLGKRLGRLFSPGQTLPTIFSPQQGLAATAPGRIQEFSALHKTGSTFPVELMMATIEMEGADKSLAMIVDATEKHKLRQIRQTFVSMVRTELKAPLTKVASFFSQLGSLVFGPISEKAADTTVLMEQNIERLLVLLNDLFDLEKLESGKIEIERSPAKLKTIFERSVSAVQMFAQKHKVQIQVNDCDLVLPIDANRIVQVLVNFLSNAIKFSPAGSVVTVAVRQTADHVQIGVIDHGRGVPASHLQSIFVAYKQVEESDAKKKGGTGLGLAICKAIVESHGGEIGVDSEEGKGSIFWLKLPKAGET